MAPRKSEAEVPLLIQDPDELARREAQNALDQFDWAMERVEDYLHGRGEILKVSILLRLHRQAMNGIDPYAGNFRPAEVAIKGSRHVPVSGDDVPTYVEEMLDYLRDKWDQRSAYHLCAYAMWRLNWIHPFADGNGRTSRILSYMVLCAKIGIRLPGKHTIPEQISENKDPYYDALEHADEAFAEGKIDVSMMEALLQGHLANQLLDVHKLANGELPSAVREIKARSALPGVTRESYLVRKSRQVKLDIIQTIERHPSVTALIVGLLMILVMILGLMV